MEWSSVASHVKKKINTVAKVFCNQCAEYQCTGCSKVHEMSTLLSGHDLVDVEDAQPAKPVLDIKGLAMCD